VRIPKMTAALSLARTGLSQRYAECSHSAFAAAMEVVPAIPSQSTCERVMKICLLDDTVSERQKRNACNILTQCRDGSLSILDRRRTAKDWCLNDCWLRSLNERDYRMCASSC